MNNGLAQRLFYGQQMPSSHHLLNSFLAALSLAGERRQALCETGGPVVSM